MDCEIFSFYTRMQNWRLFALFNTLINRKILNIRWLELISSTTSRQCGELTGLWPCHGRWGCCHSSTRRIPTWTPWWRSSTTAASTASSPHASTLSHLKMCPTRRNHLFSHLLLTALVLISIPARMTEFKTPLEETFLRGLRRSLIWRCPRWSGRRWDCRRPPWLEIYTRSCSSSASVTRHNSGFTPWMVLLQG